LGWIEGVDGGRRWWGREKEKVTAEDSRKFM
jgi:hypothetical protein